MSVLWIRQFWADGLDEMSDGIQNGSDTFQNESDIIIILSPADLGVIDNFVHD